MFDLRIETAPAALDLMQKGWPTRTISLVGDDLRFNLPDFGPTHFIARFHDVEAQVPGYVAPSFAILHAALRHVDDLKDDDRLLIHCHAGKSRSPAMALGVLVSHGQTPIEALERVKSLRPIVIPNRLMVELLDNTLLQRGELIAVVQDHYRSFPPEASLPNRGGWNL
jgi:predicted protein tyrosine phosphatase